jgi:hypothetical protein
MSMKDKLREFLKTGTRKTVMRGESGRYPNGEGWGHSWNEEVVEFNAKKLDAAILDAEGEGDGGAAPFGWWVKYANGYEDFIQRLPTDPDVEDIPTHIMPVYTHPARSGVVSDEDVRDAERYRWLRQMIYDERIIAAPNPQASMLHGERLDQALDAAIQGECHER